MEFAALYCRDWSADSGAFWIITRKHALPRKEPESAEVSTPKFPFSQPDVFLKAFRYLYRVYELTDFAPDTIDMAYAPERIDIEVYIYILCRYIYITSYIYI